MPSAPLSGNGWPKEDTLAGSQAWHLSTERQGDLSVSSHSVSTQGEAGGQRECLSSWGKVGRWMLEGGDGNGQESRWGWQAWCEAQFCALWLCKVWSASDSSLLICEEGGDLGLAEW